MELRDYQQRDLNGIREAYRTHKRVLYVAPTGSGKTELFTHIALKHLERHSHGLVYILVHRTELIEQVKTTVGHWGAEAGEVSPDHFPKPSDRIVVASVQSLIRRLPALRHPTFLITDEAHHATAQTVWGKVAACYQTALHLGVTATPLRLSGAGMAQCFDALVLGPSTAELIRLGYLAQPIVYCPAVPDLTGTHTRAGEFISADLERILDRSTITGDAVEAYRKFAYGKQFVAFGVSRAHIGKIAAAFNAAGIRAAAIDGSTAPKIRAGAIEDFRARRISGLISCQLIDEGFNVPEIGCGIDLAPTKSLGRYLQRVGRCLRSGPDKRTAVILDLAGNALRHGLPDANHAWSLAETRQQRTGTPKDPVPSIRICPKCLGASKSSADSCQLCEYEFPINGRTFLTQKGPLEILRAEKAALIAEKKSQAEANRRLQRQATGYGELVALARQRKYKNPEHWAGIIWAARKRNKNKMRARI
jgi:DNA repair protein RadD